VDVHFWFWIVGSVGMAYAMGRAGAVGMLRRTLYTGTLYQPYLTVAMIGALVMAIGFLAFLINVLATLGWANTLSLVIPEKWLKPRLGRAKA
jgi:heme/copper-type cytochrome/quinol oxidase subunit 1